MKNQTWYRQVARLPRDYFRTLTLQLVSTLHRDCRSSGVLATLANRISGHLQCRPETGFSARALSLHCKSCPRICSLIYAIGPKFQWNSGKTWRFPSKAARHNTKGLPVITVIWQKHVLQNHESSLQNKDLQESLRPLICLDHVNTCHERKHGIWVTVTTWIWNTVMQTRTDRHCSVSLSGWSWAVKWPPQLLPFTSICRDQDLTLQQVNS